MGSKLFWANTVSRRYLGVGVELRRWINWSSCRCGKDGLTGRDEIFSGSSFDVREIASEQWHVKLWNNVIEKDISNEPILPSFVELPICWIIELCMRVDESFASLVC